MSTSQSRRPFEVLPTIDGFEVIDAHTGRAIDRRSTRASANGVAYQWNNRVETRLERTEKPQNYPLFSS